MQLGRRSIATVLVPLVMLLSFRGFCVSVGANDFYEEAKMRIVEGFCSFEDSIDIEKFGLPKEALPALLSEIVKDDPFLFYVDSRVSYLYRGDGCVVTVKPQYTMIPSDVGIAWAYCRRLIDGMVSGIEGSDGEKALLLHDLICRGFSYDESLKNEDLYSFLLNGSGTCQAYTSLYTALLRRVGIEAHFVASDAISHMWNLVKLDGEWYHVDVTWDDTADNVASHRHFLLSDRMARERGHRDWYSVGAFSCNSEKYANGDIESLLHGAFLIGDADHDGEASLTDLLLLRRRERGMICAHCADIDGDGTVDDEDVFFLRMKILEGD